MLISLILLILLISNMLLAIAAYFIVLPFVRALPSLNSSNYSRHP
jgi:hypothetical protein